MQRIKLAGSTNSVVMYDENGQRVHPQETIFGYLREMGIVFVDRDGSEHTLPTEAHRSVRVMPTKMWCELTEDEKKAEQKRFGGDWPQTAGERADGQ